MAFSQMVVVIAVLFSFCCVENIDDSNYREVLFSTKHLKIMMKIKRERERLKKGPLNKYQISCASYPLKNLLIIINLG